VLGVRVPPRLFTDQKVGMEKDDSFWLNICYISFAAICAFIAWHAINTIGIETGWLERYDSWYLPVNHAAAIVIGLGSAWLLRADPERHEYFLASIGELRKVSWPSMQDTRRMTIIVCVVVAIFAVIMAIFDLSWSYVLRGIISFFAG
jgi:preprotein translocase SecE subunit